MIVKFRVTFVVEKRTDNSVHNGRKWKTDTETTIASEVKNKFELPYPARVDVMMLNPFGAEEDE